jgi:iron-sulfur cluster insertion protein
VRILAFTISERAISLYKEEMGLKKGDCIRLFVRYLGASESGFSLGIEKDNPEEEDYIQAYDGIAFFVRPNDHWFIVDMTLDYDPEKDVIIAHFPALD